MMFSTTFSDLKEYGFCDNVRFKFLKEVDDDEIIDVEVLEPTEDDREGLPDSYGVIRVKFELPRVFVNTVQTYNTSSPFAAWLSDFEFDEEEDEEEDEE